MGYSSRTSFWEQLTCKQTKQYLTRLCGLRPQDLCGHLRRQHPHVAAIQSYQLHALSSITFSFSSLHYLSPHFTLHKGFVKMADRQITQQTIFSLLAKLDDPDADLRYMSLNDLYGILTNANSSFLSHDRGTSTKLAEGLLKALDDQHGDVQNQALKWYVLGFDRL
jgi:hypothetical protein